MWHIWWQKQVLSTTIPFTAQQQRKSHRRWWQLQVLPFIFYCTVCLVFVKNPAQKAQDRGFFASYGSPYRSCTPFGCFVHQSSKPSQKTLRSGASHTAATLLYLPIHLKDEWVLTRKESCAESAGPGEKVNAWNFRKTLPSVFEAKLSKRLTRYTVPVGNFAS